MSDMTQKEIAVGIFHAINKRDFTEFAEYITEDLVFDFPGVDPIQGSKRVILFFNILFRKYKSLSFNVMDAMVDDEKACVKWNNSGELKDGTPYANNGVTWFQFSHGKISHMSDYFKDTSFTQ
jgi:ketosteroid isomerase-like protein